MSWSQVRLGDVAQIVQERTFPSHTATGNYLSTDSMLPNVSGVLFGKSQVPDGKVTTYSIGDTLFSNIRTYFRKVWISNCIGACSNDVLVFRAMHNKLNEKFLYYTCIHKDFTEHSIRTSKGAKMPRGDKKALLNYQFLLPPLPEQQEIAAILGALDDKIENNRQTAETLEEMARALYRSWFVDFDPVHARAEGRLPAHMDATTAALFPDRFGADGLPEGWEYKSLSEFANFLNGLALKKFPPKENEYALPVIKIAELRNGITNKTSFASAKIQDKFIVKDGDVLFSWSGSLMQKIWIGGEGALNQHLFKITSSKVPQWFHYFAVEQHISYFRQIAASKATTMGHIQRHHLDEAMNASPPVSLIRRLNLLIEPLFLLMKKKYLESQTLTTLRDTLLPRLMSGELRVKAAREFVEKEL